MRERTAARLPLVWRDKDQATRDRLHALHDKATGPVARVQSATSGGGKTIEATREELEGLPADYIARHPAQKAKTAGTRDADDGSARHDGR